jgi:hypothetical protein
MMKLRPLFLLLTAISVLSVSCKKSIEGSGVYITEKRMLPDDYDRIISEGDFEVTLIRDSARFIVLHGETNILPEVITHVSGSTLSLSYGNFNTHYHHGSLKIYVHTPEISAVSLFGTGSIYSEAAFSETISVTNTNSGSIELFCSTSAISTSNSGPGNITLHGISESATHVLSGSGSLNAFDLITNRAIINISGAANCNVHVIEQLNVTISGSGNVHYIGTPSLQTDISGSGSVTKE